MKINIAYKRVVLSRDKIINKFIRLRKKYEKYISCKNEVFLGIFFSIMIMENYNRPLYLRSLEYLLFICKKMVYKEVYMTLGIMQMRTNVLIGDVKSIKLAEKFIRQEISCHHFSNINEMISYIALKYNPSQLYKEEILKIYHCIASVEQ